MNITPLDYMLAVVRDPTAHPDRRDRMAAAAAPYIHPRLSNVEATVRTGTTVQLTEDERRERARQAILEAFAERPPPAVEGSYKVIAGKDNREAAPLKENDE